MIAYLAGKIVAKSPTQVQLDIGGIAYELNISLNTYERIEELDKARLFTKLIIRENEHTLYGFYEEDEKKLFTKLISVKGVGPNTARVILSYMSPKETVSAILHDNVAAFKKVKGVGPKTAQQIILDLKNKVAKENLALNNDKVPNQNDNNIREEAISALLALGFQRTQVVKIVDKTLAQDVTYDQVEVLIKAILKQL